MKNLLLAPLLFISFTFTASASTYVEGYFKSDGTYVKGHYRSSANNSIYDNYSTKGNVNPYTGKKGTKKSKKSKKSYGSIYEW